MREATTSRADINNIFRSRNPIQTLLNQRDYLQKMEQAKRRTPHTFQLFKVNES